MFAHITSHVTDAQLIKEHGIAITSTYSRSMLQA